MDDPLLYEKFPPSPEARLASLLDSIFHNQPVSPDVREWLIKAFVHYLRLGGEYPLDRFLGLAPIDSGKSSLSTRLGLLKRNMHLVDALQKIAVDDSVSGWARYQRLANEISKFEPCAWKLYKHFPVVPDGLSAWQQDLFLAFKTGMRIPRTAHGLYSVLNQVGEVSFNSPGVRLLASLTQVNSK